MTHIHHDANEFMSGARAGGLWSQPGFLRLQRTLHRQRKLLIAQLRVAADTADVEVIRIRLRIVEQRIATPPAGVSL